MVFPARHWSSPILQTFIYMPLKLRFKSPPNTKALRNFTNQAVYPCVQAVLCCSGFSISLQPFELHVGPVRGEWREQRVALDEVLVQPLVDCCRCKEGFYS